MAAPSLEHSTRTLHLRIKDKHAPWLLERAREVNMVWNFCNELGFKHWLRTHEFMSAYDIQKYTDGATKEGLGLHSHTVQAIGQEYVTRRRQFKKVKLQWRASRGARRSLGWVPLKASAIRYKSGQVWIAGLDKPLSLWDSYGLADYELGTGSLSEDARGRWYLNVTVKALKAPVIRVRLASAAIGVDLGLKDFMADSEGRRVSAPQFYRDLASKLAVSQRASKPKRVRAIHAKIGNRRKDFLHKLSTAQVKAHCAIFVGDVNAQALTQTTMAKSVLDAGWSTYRTMLRYKCDSAGVWFKEIDERYSTQECSHCGERTGPKGLAGLSVRVWTCRACGSEHQRDINAAINIRNRGLDWLEQAFTKSESYGAVMPRPMAYSRPARPADAVNKDSGA